MIVLYVENFRGFTKQYIPLKDVNFFLGENSTGKTSILALIKLFFSPDFWLNKDFNAEEYQFGNYGDIASVNAKGIDYFRVGFISCSERQSEGEVPKSDIFLMEFREEDGIPVIYKYCCIQGLNVFQSLFANKTIKYWISKIEYGKKPLKAIKQTFESWLVSDLNEANFKKLKKPPSGYKEMPDGILMSNMLSGLMKKDKYLQYNLNGFDFVKEVVWIAPLRSKPKKTYDQINFVFSSEGEHTPFLIRKILKDKNSELSQKFLKSLKEYGEESGLFKDIEINSFGEHPASPFELKIVTEDKSLNVCNVGYGVNQSLPVLVELFARPKNIWYAIQQPEVHLHPRAQAALGDVFFNVALKEKKRFFIETHSDFIVDRFRLNVNKNKDCGIESQVIFFEQKNGVNTAQSIEILPDGKYQEGMPESFYSFFIKEDLSILRLQ
ncbi:MAG: AAA family ATPase [Nitrospirae bacterium]|uniref:AAA family ATPase n=1 Tax=Candidatus Magnetobacterium casense TaxID=1455061 RepID=UPI00058AE9A1|nr:AAA family ATPase [Candidatus Magnetobacterium casensis]MBF0337360.1 AAA family ATPase [Nitrospirota bacterium]